MPGEERISLVLEGLASEDGHIRFRDFVNQLKGLSSAVYQTDELVAGSSAPTMYLRVVELRHSSPTTVVLEAVPYQPTTDLRLRVFDAFFEIVKKVSQRVAPDGVPTELLKSLRRIGEPIGKRQAAATLQRGDTAMSLSAAFAASIDLVLAPEMTEQGSVRGMLEAINLHESANVFRIYPDFGPAKVTCHFPSALRDAAIASIGKFIEVRGTLKFRSADPFPHEMDVSEVEVLPAENDLPSLMDLRGTAPDATGDLSSEVFIRRLRDATE